MKRHSYKKNNKNVNKRLSKINGGRPPEEDNQCKIIGNMEGHSKHVTCVTFHSTLPLIATGSIDHTAKLWLMNEDCSNVKCISTLEGESNVRCVAFHLTLPILATGWNDYTGKLWRLIADFSDAECVATLKGHTASVDTIAFHPSLPVLATGSTDKTPRLWLLNTDYSAVINVKTLQGHPGWVYSVVFHPYLPILAIGGGDDNISKPGGIVKLWRLNLECTAAVCVATLTNRYDGSCQSVAFHPTDPILAIANGHNIKLWRLNSDSSAAECVFTVKAHIHCIKTIAFHPTLPTILVSQDYWFDTTTKFWRLNDDGSALECIATMHSHKHPYTSFSFHPYLPIIAISTEDKTVKLWRCKILEIPNYFTIYSKKTDISETICNSVCPICNFELCMKNPKNLNNNNGYIVKLLNNTLAPVEHLYIHFKCLYRHLVNGHFTIDKVSIRRQIIQQLLNIDNKADALIGSDFYN